MIVFPQLSSGAVAQFPFQRERHYRTLANRSADGSDIRTADVDFHERVWELPYAGLSDAEWQALQDLFVLVEGRLQSFLFLEPGANLLSWSELFSSAVWQKDAGISVAGGQADPLGGTGAGHVSNSGGEASLRQTLPIPASLHYAASVWARTASTGAKLRLSDTGGQAAEALLASDNQWRRYPLGAQLASAMESTQYSIVVPAAGLVEIYGPQLEAQPAPSFYKRTLQQAGVYPKARFDHDVLADQATGMDQHSGVIRISWTPSQT